MSIGVRVLRSLGTSGVPFWRRCHQNRRPRAPNGVRVVRSRDAYNEARADWIARHGCDDNAENCSFLHQENLDQQPPENDRPYVVMASSPSFMSTANGGTIQWWTENVSDCEPTGQFLQLVGGASGQRRMGRRQYDGWRAVEQQNMYGITCQGPNGTTFSDTERLTWFDRRGDEEAPAVPSDLTAESTEGGIRLTWSEAEDNFYVAAYRLYRDGEWFTTVSSQPEYLDEEAPEGTHEYQVQAFDSFGNLSELSSPVEAER